MAPLDRAKVAAAYSRVVLSQLLPEIADEVLRYLGLDYHTIHPRQSAPTDMRTARTWLPVKLRETTMGSAAIPPRDGSSPSLAVPQELRCKIFADELLAKDHVVQPKCGPKTDGKANGEAKHNRCSDLTIISQPNCGPKTDGKTNGGAKHNRCSDLMVINKAICGEITTMLYEERTFAIHVHEGFKNGGVEFLNIGRQPLQYQAGVTDHRFEKFRPGQKFGFDSIKKINLTVFPADGDWKHVSVNTYFVNLALVNLLERAEGENCKNRITNIRIDFASERKDDKAGADLAGRHAIMKREGGRWWDSSTDMPRETSFHGTSDIQMVLLPFSRLRCHNVHIQLPDKLAAHLETALFVSELENTMTGHTLGDMMDDSFQCNLEKVRDAYEDHVSRVLHGGSHAFQDVGKITERELDEDRAEAEKRRASESGEDLSPSSKRQRGGGSVFVDDEDFMRAAQSQIEEDEEADLMRAIEESLKDLEGPETQARTSRPPRDDNPLRPAGGKKKMYGKTAVTVAPGTYFGSGGFRRGSVTGSDPVSRDTASFKEDTKEDKEWKAAGAATVQRDAVTSYTKGEMSKPLAESGGGLGAAGRALAVATDAPEEPSQPAPDGVRAARVAVVGRQTAQGRNGAAEHDLSGAGWDSEK